MVILILYQNIWMKEVQTKQIQEIIDDKQHYNKENPIPDRVLRCIAWQLLEALIELKSVNITHRVYYTLNT